MQNYDACKQVFWTAVSTGHTPENAVLESDRACILECMVDQIPAPDFPAVCLLMQHILLPHQACFSRKANQWVGQ